MHDLGRKVAILGLGKSGRQSAEFLAEAGFRVYISDPKDTLENQQGVQELRSQGIDAECGSHQLSKIADCDWILPSPGVPPANSILSDALNRKQPVWSEIEIASRFCPAKQVIAVTGTSGKTTVTTLIYQLMQAAGRIVICCGNIGNPWIGELKRLSSDTVVVVEVSSFQLCFTQCFAPCIGVLVNVSPNHLDWHPNMEHYTASKLKMFEHQKPSDFHVIRKQDALRYFPKSKFQSKCCYYDAQEGESDAARILYGISKIDGIPSDNVSKVLKNFKGIEHRLELFKKAGGIAFINDSKSTTPLSLAYALNTLPSQKVILLAGGRAKSRDFDSLGTLLNEKVKKAVLFGEAAPMLYQMWSTVCPCVQSDNWDHAVEEAVHSAREGDSVLLSPGCASFDLFRSYEDRGRQFKHKITQLTSSWDMESVL